MTQYEYKVVPAPRRSDRIEGLAKTDDAYALTIASLMNDHGRGGWEYMQSERLPCQTRAWFFGTRTKTQEVFVFRRALTKPTDVFSDNAVDVARIRARRVRKQKLVEFVQSGGRRIELREEARPATAASSPSSSAFAAE